MDPESEDFAAAATAIVGPGGLRRAAELAGLDPGFHRDNLKAGLAALPRSTAEAAALVALCRRHRVPIVPQGGRTGLAGGAASGPGALVLMTDRLDRIVEIDPSAMLAVVEAGVTLQALEEAAAAHGLSAGIDLAARGTATIGGMIATNAGGMSAFRRGTMRRRLLGIEAVLPDGSVLDDMARVPKCNEGYDLKQLFCGSEGTLGVITRAVVELAPADGPATTLLAACTGAAAALDVFRRLQRARGLDLRAGEIMWSAYALRVAGATGLGHVLAFAGAPLYAIFEVAGRGEGDDMAELLVAELGEAIEAGAVLDAVVAASARERAEIWRVREDSFIIDRTLPHALWYDVSVPLAGLDAYEVRVRGALAGLDRSLEFYLFGHLGDGNLHVTIGNGTPLPPAAAKAVDAVVYEGLKAAGGSISAEHGIGTEKRASLATHASPEKLRLMVAIKRALDPEGIMNPGKVL
jgi:FAD/FMN-containing dehydrogenase